MVNYYRPDHFSPPILLFSKCIIIFLNTLHLQKLINNSRKNCPVAYYYVNQLFSCKRYWSLNFPSHYQFSFFLSQFSWKLLFKHNRLVDTHVIVLQRYSVVLVLVRFLRLALLRAYTRDLVERVLLDPVTHAPDGPAGPVQLVQQPLPGTGHQTATGRRVTGRAADACSATALESLRANCTQRGCVLAVTLQLAGHAPAHHLQHANLGLLPAHQRLVLRLTLARRVAASVSHFSKGWGQALD